MNCFELCIFEILNTTPLRMYLVTYLLWIALNYVSLKYWIQLCALLPYEYEVVNCFELCIFEILNTTTCGDYVYQYLLWIALNYVSLKYWIQQVQKTDVMESSCELLWIMYLWNIEYNSLLATSYISIYYKKNHNKNFVFNL